MIDGEVRPAAVAVADGVIRAVGPIDADYPAAEQIRLPETAVLLPGFVDTHVHINEPGTDWEGFATATAAAAAGGITTLVDMPLDSDPVTTTVDALSQKQQAAHGQLRGRRRVLGRRRSRQSRRSRLIWPPQAFRASSASSPTRVIRISRG